MNLPCLASLLDGIVKKVDVRADISPFGVGADFAWQASAGFGLKLSPRVYSEVVYRILDVDYRHDGLIYDTTAHGPEATLGIRF